MSFDEALRKAQAKTEGVAKRQQAAADAEQQWAAEQRQVLAQVFKALTDGGVEHVLMKPSDTIIVFLMRWPRREQDVYIDSQGGLYEGSNAYFVIRAKKWGEKEDYVLNDKKLVYKRENGLRLMEARAAEPDFIRSFCREYSRDIFENCAVGWVLERVAER